MAIAMTVQICAALMPGASVTFTPALLPHSLCVHSHFNDEAASMQHRKYIVCGPESFLGDSVPALNSHGSNNLQREPQILGLQEVDLVHLSLGREPLTQSCESVLLLGVRLKRTDCGRRRRRRGESSLNRNTCGGSSNRPWRSKDLANLNQSLKSLGQSQFTGKSLVVTLAPSALPPVSTLTLCCACCLVLSFFILSASGDGKLPFKQA